MGRTEISDQINRILQSQSLANKSQLRKLLEVLSNNLDSPGTLKPDRIIKELWPEETRTKGSADVAKEMNRLRHALEIYYAVEGKNDPVIVTLPNRSAPAPDGKPEKRWIVAAPRGADEPAAAHPVNRKFTLIAMTVTVVLIAGGYILFPLLTGDRRPQSGRMDGTVLTILNAEGKELWKKNFPEGFSMDWYYQKGLRSRIWFGDLEGKGHTGVLFSYMPTSNPMSRSSTLICYSDRGKETWRWTPGRELPELPGSRATYATWAIGVLKATESRPERIVVLSQHQPWWPSQVALLDSKGKTISEYWHSGGLSYMTLADLDGDGKQEIILTGISEYDHQATLVVLDPERVTGASTEEKPEFQIHGMGAAQEKVRLLFPRSDLNRALFQFNMAMDPDVEHGSLRLTVAECITPAPGCRIYYEFDKHLRLIAAYAGGDEFRSAHESFYRTGKDAHRLSAEEQSAFQKVRCLVGCSSEYVAVGNILP
ncbi:MAG: hypothetical protein WCF26_20745 [Candidatus Sulfotelmatobacter sp.]